MKVAIMTSLFAERYMYIDASQGICFKCLNTYRYNILDLIIDE